jgi:flagellar biosynthetic protein FliQ
MTPELAVQVVRDALITCLFLAAPILILAFLVGIGINIVQVATSMQDSAFSALPRLAAFAAGMLLLMPWMLHQLSTYTIRLFGDLTPYAR